jgi:hypothetical protein
MLSGKKWLFAFSFFFVAAASACALSAYEQDPLLRYGYDDRTRFWALPALMDVGIAENYNYGAAIIGSSMAVQFDMAFFKREMHMEPVKLAIGGITIPDTKVIYDAVQKNGGAKVIMINIDINGFNREYDIDNPFGLIPRFLQKGGISGGVLNNLRYLFMYEVWFRLIPANLAARGIVRIGLDYPSVTKKLNIDTAYAGSYPPSKQVVIDNYIQNRFAATKENPLGMEERMRKNIDEFLTRVLREKREGQSLVFAFPPYSALYWYITQKDGTFSALMSAKSFFIEKCEGTEGVRVVDMQDIDEAADLENYADTTHYGDCVQSVYARALLDGSRDVATETFPLRRAKLEALVERFARENADWLMTTPPQTRDRSKDR